MNIWLFILHMAKGALATFETGAVRAMMRTKT